MKTPKPRFSRRHLPRRLRVLVGTWKVEVTFPWPPRRQVRGVASFRWLVKDALLIMRMSFPGGPPVSTAVIGADDVLNVFYMLYTDERGVVRVLNMEFTRNHWSLFRKSPGFWQRFRGVFSRDHRTIRGAWEKSQDGERWMLDFPITYTKRR